MPGQKVVDDDGFLAAREQRAHVVRADVAGSAANQDGHTFTPLNSVCAAFAAGVILSWNRAFGKHPAALDKSCQNQGNLFQAENHLFLRERKGNTILL